MRIEPNEIHQACMKDFKGVLEKYKDKLSAQEMLALTAQLCGNLVALQDQKTMTSEKALAIVGRNLETGNRAVIIDLMSKEAVGNA